MKTPNIFKRSLCSYDPRSDIYADLAACCDEMPPARINCACDSCYYGRDELAVIGLGLHNVVDLLKKACGIQANLLSTATDGEKDEFISIIYSIYNEIAIPVLDKMK